MPSIEQIAVGAATTPLSEPLAPLVVDVVEAADVIVSISQPVTVRRLARAFLPGRCQFPATATHPSWNNDRNITVDAEFADTVRDLLMALASGAEHPKPLGG